MNTRANKGMEPMTSSALRTVLQGLNRALLVTAHPPRSISSCRS